MDRAWSKKQGKNQLLCRVDSVTTRSNVVETSRLANVTWSTAFDTRMTRRRQAAATPCQHIPLWSSDSVCNQLLFLVAAIKSSHDSVVFSWLEVNLMMCLNRQSRWVGGKVYWFYFSCTRVCQHPGWMSWDKMAKNSLCPKKIVYCSHSKESPIYVL